MALRQVAKAPVAQEAQLRELVAAGWTIAQIGAQYGRSPATVAGWLREAGITGVAAAQRRGRGGTPSLPPLDPVLLHHLYVEQLRTIREIAAQLQVSADRVGKGLRAAGIERRPTGSISGRAPLPTVTRQQLLELYVERRLPLARVAAELGVSSGWVTRQLEAHGIARRARSDRVPEFEINAPTLHRLYVSEQLDDVEIAARFGVPTHRVVQRRRTLGVFRAPVPPPHPPRPEPPPAAELRRLYCEQHQTLAQIAHRYRTSSPRRLGSGSVPRGSRWRRAPAARTEGSSTSRCCASCTWSGNGAPH